MTLPQSGQLGRPRCCVTGFAVSQANWMVIVDSPRRFTPDLAQSAATVLEMCGVAATPQ
jgi:hypothetical protein